VRERKVTTKYGDQYVLFRCGGNVYRWKDAICGGELYERTNTQSYFGWVYEARVRETNRDQAREMIQAWALDAAAPDLLAVCQEIRYHFDYFSEWDLPIGFEDRLNAALAKAGCEPEGDKE
jgi:hypothetical protein